jgi:cytoskeletal protein CcmA (bactofilin family)
MSFFGNRRQAEPAPPPEPAQKTAAPQPAPAQQLVGFETVLGANSEMEGILRSSANVRLDGTFSGTLEITGNVLVGETARINADVNAKNISIAGAVRGNVTGKKVQLLRTGRIWGDIHANALTTEEGAFIDGKITMLGHEASEPEEEAEEFEPQRIIQELKVVGLGAVAEHADEMFHDTFGDDTPPLDDMVDNISEGDEDELYAGGEAPEGQANDEPDDGPDDEVRQST